MNVPHELWDYYNKNGYFISYYGDVYYGNIFNVTQFPESSFICQPSNRREFLKRRDDKGVDLTLEDLTELSWEVKSFDIFPDVKDGNQELGCKEGYSNIGRVGNHEWKKMFVFGAGASAFSVFKDGLDTFRKFSYSPPIANELFGNKYEDYIRKFPGVQLSLPSLRVFGNDVEAFFQKEWSSIRTAMNKRLLSRHINISFFLRELFLRISEETISEFRHHSLYGAFSDMIKEYCSGSRKAAFVSFNYDTILDYYLEQAFSTDLSSTDAYIDINRNSFFLFKPHGSCNWGIPVQQKYLGEMPTTLHEYVYENQLSFADVYYNLAGSLKEMINQDSWGQEYEVTGFKTGRFTFNKKRIQRIRSEYKNFLPSLLIPYRDKDEFVMPYSHYDYMSWYVRDMEDLYLIGWKGNEASFNNLLKRQANNLKRIFIVNPNPQEVETNLSKYLSLDKYEIQRYNDFESFLIQHQL